VEPRSHDGQGDERMKGDISARGLRGPAPQSSLLRTKRRESSGDMAVNVVAGRSQDRVLRMEKASSSFSQNESSPLRSAMPSLLPDVLVPGAGILLALSTE